MSDVRIEPATIRIPGGRVPIELPLRLVKVKTMAFSETIVVYDIKVGRRNQLKSVHETLWVSKVKVIHWHWSNSIGFNIFQLLFLKLTTDFNISSPLRWAIQDQWSSGYLLSFLFILTFRTIIFLFHFPVHHHIKDRLNRYFAKPMNVKNFRNKASVDIVSWFLSLCNWYFNTCTDWRKLLISQDTDYNLKLDKARKKLCWK